MARYRFSLSLEMDADGPEEIRRYVSGIAEDIADEGLLSERVYVRSGERVGGYSLRELPDD